MPSITELNRILGKENESIDKDHYKGYINTYDKYNKKDNQITNIVTQLWFTLINEERTNQRGTTNKKRRTMIVERRTTT